MPLQPWVPKSLTLFCRQNAAWPWRRLWGALNSWNRQSGPPGNGRVALTCDFPGLKPPPPPVFSGQCCAHRRGGALNSCSSWFHITCNLTSTKQWIQIKRQVKVTNTLLEQINKITGSQLNIWVFCTPMGKDWQLCKLSSGRSQQGEERQRCSYLPCIVERVRTIRWC